MFNISNFNKFNTLSDVSSKMAKKYFFLNIVIKNIKMNDSTIYDAHNIVNKKRSFNYFKKSLSMHFTAILSRLSRKLFNSNQKQKVSDKNTKNIAEDPILGKGKINVINTKKK